MAILTALPERAIIRGYKGTIDYYLWKGLPVARSWPKSPGKHRSPAVMAQWPTFIYAAREWNNLSPAVREAYAAIAPRGGLSARDLQIRSYINGLYRNPQP